MSIERHAGAQEVSAAHPIECEPVSTICRWLLVAPADRQTGEVAIEQCSGAPVTDNGQDVIAEGLRNDLLDGANDPRLSIYGRLPASDAGCVAKNASTVASNSCFGR